MKRYFFNVDNLGIGPDLVGELLASDEEAWKEAITTAAQMIKDLDGKFRPGQEWNLQVTDEHRNPIYQISINAKQII